MQIRDENKKSSKNNIISSKFITIRMKHTTKRMTFYDSEMILMIVSNVVVYLLAFNLQMRNWYPMLDTITTSY